MERPQLPGQCRHIALLRSASDSDSDSGGSYVSAERHSQSVVGLPLIAGAGSLAALGMLCVFAASAPGRLSSSPPLATLPSGSSFLELAAQAPGAEQYAAQPTPELRQVLMLQQEQQQLQPLKNLHVSAASASTTGANPFADPQFSLLRESGDVQQQHAQQVAEQQQQNQQLTPMGMQVTPAAAAPPATAWPAAAPPATALPAAAPPAIALPAAAPVQLVPAALVPRPSYAPQAIAGSMARAPKEHLHDGNPCADDEEQHAGLCYDTCQALTNGDFPVRQSPWTCCNQQVCNPASLLLGRCCRGHMGFCSGFDIAGLQEGNKVCPHKPGVCLEDEELFLNICYMRCSLLTQGKLPHRVGAATCCRNNDMTCLLDEKVGMVGIHGNSETSNIFDVGGGCGDGRNTTKCSPHMPQQMLTESK